MSDRVFAAISAILRRGPGLTAAADYVAHVHRDRVVLVDQDGPLTGAGLAAALAEAIPPGPPSLLTVAGRHHRSTLIRLLAAASAGWDVAVVRPGTERSQPTEPIGYRPAGRLWLGTTGTTGDPVHSARPRYGVGLIRPARQLWRVWQMSSAEPMLVEPALYHGYGLGIALFGMITGRPVLLPADADHRDDLIATRRPTLTVSVPLQLDRLRPQPGWSPRVMISGSSPLSMQVQQRATGRFGAVLHNLFGSTEAGFATMATPADLTVAPGCVGRPLAGVGVRLDPGTGVVRVHSPFATQPGGWVATGDRGHWDHRGLLHLDGRTDRLVVSNGRNVSLDRIAGILRQHPAVADVDVTAVTDPIAGHRIVAVVRAAAPATSAELRDWVRDRAGVGISIVIRI